MTPNTEKRASTARVYKTKGPDKLSVNLNIPMREADAVALNDVALALGVPKTQLARDYILDGIGAARPLKVARVGE